MINQDATIMDYQKHLEQNILKINSKTFNQVVVLGSSSFIPFMQLKNSFRRDVIEEILDIKVFSIMNILAKQKQKELDESIKELKKDIEVTGDKILTQQKYIKEAEKQIAVINNLQKFEVPKAFYFVSKILRNNGKYMRRKTVQRLEIY